jgi:hypothetical protein
LIGDGYTPLGSSNITAIDQDDPPVEITANAICCGVVCQFATFHADDPELAAPVLEGVCDEVRLPRIRETFQNDESRSRLTFRCKPSLKLRANFRRCDLHCFRIRHLCQFW